MNLLNAHFIFVFRPYNDSQLCWSWICISNDIVSQRSIDSSSLFFICYCFLPPHKSNFLLVKVISSGQWISVDCIKPSCTICCKFWHWQFLNSSFMSLGLQVYASEKASAIFLCLTYHSTITQSLPRKFHERI